MTPTETSAPPREEAARATNVGMYDDLRELEIDWSVPVLPLWAGELRVTD